MKLDIKLYFEERRQWNWQSDRISFTDYRNIYLFLVDRDNFTWYKN